MLHDDPADWTVLWEERRNDRIQFRTPAAPGCRTITARATRRFIQQRWADALVRSLHQARFQSRVIWAENSMFKGSGRWLSGPGGAFYGRYSFRPPLEYTILLPPPRVLRRLRTGTFPVFLRLHHRCR